MLSRQVDIYNFDTSDFYSNREKSLHMLNHKLRSERNKLVNGGTIYGNGRRKRTIVGIREIERELSEHGIGSDELRLVRDGEYDFSVHGNDADLVSGLCGRYESLKKLIEHKNRKAKETKDELLLLLSNKVEANKASGLTHHIRTLRNDGVSDNKIISVFESSFTRTIGARTGEFCDDFMIVKVFYFSVLHDLLLNGFMYNGERYVYFTSSAGQIRTKKCVFVKESTWKRVEKTIMCGLTIDDINNSGGANPNKHLAYLALANSATDVWDEFDIDKTIVIDDFETEVEGDYDFVDDVEYEIRREHGNKPITHTDGSGMMLPNAFGVSQRNKMVRIPWIKGLLGVFDFRGFIEYHGADPVITDIYGKKHDIIAEDIQVIFTKSQFKMWSHYKSWDDYKERYKKYNCSAGVTNVEEERIRNATINYQMLQSLTDISDEEISKIAGKTIDRIETICDSVDNVKNAFDVTPYNTEKTAFQKCIELYPNLINDKYAKYHLRSIIDSIVKKARSGKLDVNGKYTFILPDFYAACEHWFLGIPNPHGLLDDGEVFCWLFRKNDELDCLRSPHLFLEHALRRNVACRDYGERQKRIREWFCTDALYTSCKDMISRILQFDVDGDKSLVVADKTLISVAKRNIEMYDIVPLYYDMKKAKPVHIDNESIYDGLSAAFVGGNIGIYSNNISKIWNSDTFINGSDDDKRKAIELIKILCMENNFCIDMAKTLYMPTRPDWINDRVKEYTNQRLPHFFKYAKDKNDSQIVNTNESFVNKLESLVQNPRINLRKIGLGEIDYKLLMKNPDIDVKVSTTGNGRIIKEETDPIIVAYCDFDKKYYLSIDSVLCSGRVSKSEAYMRAISKKQRIIKEIREALSQFGRSEDDIVDILVKYLYGTKKSFNKTALWLCYGDIIYDNLSSKIKLGKKAIQCVDCGKWFEVNIKDTESCRCSECRDEYKKILKKEQNRRAYIKKKISVARNDS